MAIGRARPLVLILILLFHPSPRIVTDEAVRMSIWNVGQGQWVTLITPHLCRHFDMGGEWAPWREIARACAGKSNRVHFSHGDWDHIRFLHRAHQRLGELCVASSPREPLSAGKRRFLAAVPRCPPRPTPYMEALYVEPRREGKHWNHRAHRGPKSPSANDWGRVWVYAGRWLFPGDTTSRVEPQWLEQLQAPEAVRYLLIPHHGSQTSSSEPLFKALSGLQMAIASARQKRYGHPHPKVLQRYQRHGIPVLTTELWGSLHVELKQ